MKTAWIFVSILCLVGGESFQSDTNQGIRGFEAPDVTGSDVNGSPDWDAMPGSLMTPFDEDFEVPTLSEWNHDETKFGLKELILGAEAGQQLHLIHEESDVGAILVAVCRRCMVTLDVPCISQFCLLNATLGGEPEPETDALANGKVRNAFVTGASLHADILCSLCKQSRDVTCTMKLCVNPERDKIAAASGIECMQGFCRWQKTDVVNTGYSNYLNAWWMPQSMYLWVDEVAREVGKAYYDLLNVTSTVRQALG